jgi:type III restriction enzyme
MSTPLRKGGAKFESIVSFDILQPIKDEKINMMYKLDAVDAYMRKKLVKQIEVVQLQTEN